MQEETTIWESIAAILAISALIGVVFTMLVASWFTVYYRRNVTDKEPFGPEPDDNDLNERKID